jgi:predicted kinase
MPATPRPTTVRACQDVSSWSAAFPAPAKTTLAIDLEMRCSAVRLNADEWMATLGADLYDEVIRGRVERLQREVAQRLLHLGQAVVIE